MLKFTIFSIFILFSQLVNSQSNELLVKINLNNFAFAGPGASPVTIIYSPTNRDPFVANPYGSNAKISYNFAIAFQRNTKSRLVYGIAASYENLKTQIRITNPLSFENTTYIGDGENFLKFQYLNLHPFIGLSVADKGDSRIDINLVSDVAYLLKSNESVNYFSNQGTLEFNYNRDQPKNDYRIGFGTSIFISRFSIHIEYLIGISNFDPDKGSPLVDVDNSIYSKVFRFGIGYLLTNKKSSD